MLDIMFSLLGEMYKGENKMMNKVVDIIAGFLIDRTGNEIFDKWKEKRKIKRILKEDSKNIKRIFNIAEKSDLYKLIEEFVMFHVFTETLFYSSMDLTLEQENELWERFKKYISQENSDNYVDHSYKSKIIRCVNLHNKAINSIIMDEKSKIHIKTMQSEHESIRKSLNQIIDTLNTETPLQDKNDKLGFIVSQIESIMKSYRFDISQLRRLQLVCIGLPMLIMLIMAITIPLSLKYVSDINTIYMMLIFIVVFVVLSLAFGGNISFKLKKLEADMRSARKSLLDFHDRIYYHLITNEYAPPCFYLEELGRITNHLIETSHENNMEVLQIELNDCIGQMKELYRKEQHKIEESHHLW